jgi:hypothetical protein
VGLTTSKDASDDTVIGLILRDVANRIRGEKMNASAPPRQYFFDNRERFVDQETGDKSKNAFMAVVTIAFPDNPPPHSHLAAVVVNVHPLPNPNQTTIPNLPPKATFTLLKTTASGKGWRELDPSYEPRIDF